MSKCAEILVVEDNSGDVGLLREAFAVNGSSVRLSFARDGEEALKYLRRENGYSGAPRPDLVVVDLKLPRMDGLSFLRVKNADPSLEDLDVVVLTGSDAPEDRSAASSEGVKGYFTKPSGMKGWMSVAERLESFTSNDQMDRQCFQQ